MTLLTNFKSKLTNFDQNVIAIGCYIQVFSVKVLENMEGFEAFCKKYWLNVLYLLNFRSVLRMIDI